MLEKIIRIGVVVVAAAAVYWAFTLLFSAIGFIYTTIALGIIGFLLIVGVIIFVLREFGVTF